MKKIITLAFALLLGASLSFAQAGSSDKPAGTEKAASGDTKTKAKSKSKKGGKKSAKKKSTDATTAPK